MLFRSTNARAGALVGGQALSFRSTGKSSGWQRSLLGRLVVAVVASSSVLVCVPNGIVPLAEAAMTVSSRIRVNVDANGGQAGGGQAALNRPAVNYDGSQVAFNHTEPLPYQYDFPRQRIFVKNTVTGAIAEVALASDRTTGESDSFSPAIDASGRYVAYRSFSSDISPADTNGLPDVFVTDRDPDGNEVELSATNFANQEDYLAFMRSEAFRSNVEGHAVDAQRYIAEVRSALGMSNGKSE